MWRRQSSVCARAPHTHPTPHSRAAAAAELASVSPSPSQRIPTHVADVGDDAAARAAVRAAAAAHGGRIDVLVNSAGVSGPKRFEETSAGDFEGTFRVNVVGSRNAIFHALPFMAPAGGRGGRIVLVSSQAGQTGLYGYTAYSASKFALRGLFESLSQELAARRILVSLAFPPDTDTPMLAAENLVKPELTKARGGGVRARAGGLGCSSSRSSVRCALLEALHAGAHHDAPRRRLAARSSPRHAP